MPIGLIDPTGVPEWEALIATLREKWANLPADCDELETVTVFLRAAYGLGYVDALQTARPTPV